MKRLQIMIEEDLDSELGRLAAQRHTSKAALIREFVRREITPLPPLEEDPIFQMIGVDEWEPEHHDAIIYG